MHIATYAKRVIGIRGNVRREHRDRRIYITELCKGNRTIASKLLRRVDCAVGLRTLQHGARAIKHSVAWHATR